ncbi:MAG: amidohydrolase [Halanaeroarchaeum sp.]
MTTPADVVFVDGEFHAFGDAETVAEAVAVRDGRIVRVGSTYEIDFLTGVETDVVDLGGRTVLPGFVDAHTHMLQLGRTEVHADLAGAESLDEALDRLQAEGAGGDAGGEWILGFGWDETDWPDGEGPPTRTDLDAVSTERPVAASRVDLHSVALNSVAFDRLGSDFPQTDVRTEAGEPTGLLVESAAEVVREAVAPDREQTREAIEAAIDYAHERGVTGVHDMVRHPPVSRVYRDLDATGDLDLRVRINTMADRLDEVDALGLRPNHGSDFVRVGAIKIFVDGSIGSRTAKVSEPFADAPEETGTWVQSPAELRNLVGRIDGDGHQLAAHAIGDEAVEAAIDALDRPASRHRIEHLELVDESAVDRLASVGAVASVQPNFHRWAREGGLYARRLGDDRRLRSNPLRWLVDAGVPVAFGSDGMPMDPLYGIEQAVTAPGSVQRLSVTEAVRAYTQGSAYAGFDEDRLGTIERGKLADFVVLSASPWERAQKHSADPSAIDVVATVVDGDVVYDDRS